MHRARRSTVLLILAVLSGPIAAAVRSDPREPRWLNGLLLEARGDRVVVTRVLPGSPAASAGLLAGDVLLVVDDQIVSDLQPTPPVEMLRRLDRLVEERRNTSLRLVVGRGGRTLGVMLPTGLPLATVTRGALEAGQPAPPFSGKDQDGRTVESGALRGRIVLIDFWASWCPPCRDAALVVRRLAAQHGERLAVVGVSVDEDPRAYEAFVYNQHLPGRQIHDGGPAGPISSAYGAPAAGLPFSVLIAADGTIAALGRSPAEVEPALERLLAALPGRDAARDATGGTSAPHAGTGSGDDPS
ncbi:MAG TPA: redoxin family protein [Candidatus Polarisedimenticolia bacterium]|nr:redoxin family protein [Candidatus Polarisedimenticolia bacterium]